ncbi:hypothetical protein [Actinospica sp.]|jgi:hypothetical protein|uniref:hypothetical protein n=1 Tax=Actinospica sp. TaxID=1872142 RepID=UPI002B7BEEB6|nr:hypothetical protein [Actinospica sp.]HWG25540.1 hypothetical protein [Actinospica sp.]
MPQLSGKKEQRDARKTALEAEADRAGSLSLPQLGAEVMTKAFTEVAPVAAGELNYLGFGKIVARFAPGVSRTDAKLYERFSELVGEGLQVLEHASLVRFPAESMGADCYTATRLGRAALERGVVEHIIVGGSL